MNACESPTKNTRLSEPGFKLQSLLKQMRPSCIKDPALLSSSGTGQRGGTYPVAIKEPTTISERATPPVDAHRAEVENLLLCRNGCSTHRQVHTAKIKLAAIHPSAAR